MLALDPGGHTGYAKYNEQSGTIIVGVFRESDMLDRIIERGELLIVERPFMQPGTKPVVFEVKGAIIERARHYGCYISWQEPSECKFAIIRYEINKHLKDVETQHEKDAFAHLIYYLVKRARDKITPEQVYEMYARGKEVISDNHLASEATQ